MLSYFFSFSFGVLIFLYEERQLPTISKEAYDLDDIADENNQ